MSISQDNRLLSISASFISSDAIAIALQGIEAFSQPFNLSVTILSKNHSLSSSDVIGQKCSVALHYQDSATPRYFHGRVNGFSLGELEGDFRQYTLRLVPGFWFSTQSFHHRIYEEQTAVDIISSILKEYGDFGTFEKKTSATYLKKEYCVQYGESDFDFVTRLMEEEGIAYYFIHEKDKHTMVLCDSTSGYTDCAEKNVKLNVGSDFEEAAKILSWHREMKYHAGSFEMTDYNHDTPKNFYKQTLSTKHKFAQSPGEKTIQDFGGFNFKSNGQAVHDFDVATNKNLNGVRLESLEAAHDIAKGSGYCGSFFAGGRFTLDHHIKSECNTYVITEIQHAASNKNDSAGEYQNSFSCIPDKVVFRAPQTRVKQRMGGPLTAKVVELNASTSKADADPHRMIRVEFPWADKAKSCWLRVAQAYAGAGWGASFVPRLNQEVLVDFIGGDPDRPVVVGALYNKDNQGPAYTSTQSGFKTSSKKFNELRFDDKDSEEEIYVEAGKNYNYLVHFDETGNIENNQTLTVKKDRTITISEGNESKSLGKGNQALTVAGNRETSVDGDHSESVGGDQSISVNGDQALSVGGKHDVKVSGDQTMKVTGKQTMNITGAITNKSAQKITLQANMSIELKVGGNSIKIDPSGVTITGTMVKINGSAMTEVKGGGMLKMQGGLVMIN
ncbi:MAG: type VI secretion system tip protein VgrG [Gammaproteobacteria bacterium]|nr:type VI secretion system tip protein VgrG [Gammaproteobacteria bacterium]MCP5017227.1 type VI secretion system tip protein VgrG [Ketobacter sp.]